MVIVFDLAEGETLFELGDQFGIEADPRGLKGCQGGALLEVRVERESEQTRGFQPEFEVGVALLGEPLDELRDGLVCTGAIVLDGEPLPHLMAVRFISGAEMEIILMDVTTDTKS